MALYLVERDLSRVPPERLRLDQRDIASACLQLKGEGKRIRYISSAVLPADGKAVDLFGAGSAELVKEAHDHAAVPYSRITEVLDLTPGYLARGTSRSRHSLQRVRGGPLEAFRLKGAALGMTEGASSDLGRWLADGQRFFQMCLEALEEIHQLQARKQALEGENETLREELSRIRHHVHALETDRTEMVDALGDLSNRLGQTLDALLGRSKGRDLPK
ncbi:MAG TPA: nickel-binding protein [Methylomirabilota bacterium]|jgi:hypothetical protein